MGCHARPHQKPFCSQFYGPEDADLVSEVTETNAYCRLKSYNNIWGMGGGMRRELGCSGIIHAPPRICCIHPKESPIVTKPEGGDQ